MTGIDKWPGYQIHSHNYRVPDPFRGQVVVIIGLGPSAVEISRDIATVAKEVHVAKRRPDVKIPKLDNHDNIWQQKMYEYKNWLLAQIGSPPLEEWRKKLIEECIKFLRAAEDEHGNQWDDDYWNSVMELNVVSGSS
ncbi:hypothetical protein L1049_011892 [Liquidambar formosana]|uniref:Flavin-containing monooxygenase n=1 Tax=Liquidambar formosana TaxID=63359 RepID=A0AAP0WYE7_LIQFO